MSTTRRRAATVAALMVVFGCPAVARAQTTFTVIDDASLRAALTTATGGDSIVFASSVTLTAGDLPTVASSITINGAGHTLSGAGQYRGLVVAAFSGPIPAPVTVEIQNLTIANTLAQGGSGGSGLDGGGGGAGLGGAIFVASQANVTLTNVSVVSSAASGGTGGASIGGTGSGGGGGMGGAGGSGVSGGPAGGGGGGLGSGAIGGSNTSGAAGIATGGDPGGQSLPSTGGANGGGGGSGLQGGGGGGVGGGDARNGSAGAGGFGGGGGGGFTETGGAGGFGGGGGAGIDAGSGGYGGGGGGAQGATIPGTGGFGAGAGSDGAGGSGGGGGAGLGGALFVQGGGSVTVNGSLNIDGTSVTGGAGASGGGNGIGAGSSIFLGGSGLITFAPAAGQNAVVAQQIADEAGADPLFTGAGSWTLIKDGAGTLTLSGANLYSGGTDVIGGTLSVATGASLGSGSVTLRDATTLAVTSSGAFSNSLSLEDATRIDVAAGQTATWLGTVADVDGPGSLQVSGGGVLSLANTTNSYTGGTLVTGGSTVDIAADGALGDPASGLGLGDAATSGTLAINAGSVFTMGRAIILGGGGGLFDLRPGSSVTLAGAVSGSGSLTKLGAGTLTLAGGNSYTGGTLAVGGILRAGAADVFGPGAMFVGAGAMLDLDSHSQTVGSLAGAGSITLGTATLTSGGNGATTLFSGPISGAGSLVKVGGGTLVLTGTNTYSGGTTVSAGILAGHSLSLQGNILNNASVIFEQGFAGAYGGVMSGSGSLTKTGTGMLTLTANSTFGGGTSVVGNGGLAVFADAALGAASGGVALGDGSSSGTLQFFSGSAFASNRAFALGAGGGIFDTAGTSAIRLNGALVGAGGLLKTGTGTLTLAGSANYAGATIIADGILRTAALNIFNTSSALSVAPGATLDLDGFSQSIGALSGSGNITLGSATLSTGADNSSSAFAGAISGTGSLVKEGSGTLALTGANSYTGGTTVSGGTLVGNTDSIQGAIANNALVVFDQSATGVYSGSMTGSGTLAKLGAGTLILTGTNTHTGGTIVSNGTLSGSVANLRGTIVNDAAVEFGGEADGIFDGVLAGIGSLTKSGSGTLSLLGSHSLSGTTTVAQGTLHLDGILGGSVTVAPGAIFRASGAVLGSVNVAGSLFVAPPSGAATAQPTLFAARTSAVSGNALDTSTPFLTIGGNLTMTPGSVLGLPVAPGPVPSIFVRGAASLDGARVEVAPFDLGTQRKVSVLALTAAGGLQMQNTDAVTQDPLLVPVLTQDANSLYVTLLNFGIPLSVSASGPNGTSVGRVIDELKFGATGDLGTVIRELTALDEPALGDALGVIAGEVHSSSLQLAAIDGEAFADLVRDQISARYRDAGAGINGWGGKQFEWWAQFMGERAEFDGRAGANGGTATLGGGAGGFNWRVSERWLFGAGGGFAAGQMGFDGPAASADYQAPRTFAYVGFQPRAFGLRAGGSLARSKSKRERRIQFVAALPAELGASLLLGGVDRQAQSEEVGLLSDEWGEYADNLKVKTYTIDLMVGVRRAQFGRGTFTETGAAALSLVMAADQLLTLTQTDVKLHVWRREGTFRPFFETIVRREMTEGRTTTRLHFEDAPTNDFVVEGLPLSGNAFSGRGGVTMMTKLGAWTLEYAYRRSPGQSRQSLDFRIRFK